MQIHNNGFKNRLPFPRLQEVGEEDVDVGVFGAEPFLDTGGDNVVFFCSLPPSGTTVNGEGFGDGVLGGLSEVSILRF